MATRSVVGTIDENGCFWGRYVHWDGSPSTRGPVLAAALAMYDGRLDQLLTEMIDKHFSWSNLAPRNGVLGRSYDNKLDEWRQGKIGVEGNIEEWGFFFTSRDAETAELVVVEGAEVPTEVGRVKVTELHTMTERDWWSIECGAHYERCSHMAWYHVGTDNMPKESQNLGMGKWLGTEPLEPRDAAWAVYKGQTYRITGSGYSGGYYTDPTTGRPRGRKGLWYGTVRDTETDARIDIPLYRTNSRSGEDKSISTTTLIYPKIQGE